ncbi:MAG: thioesterase family protein [Longilinea sp.]|nr:thioesterase family protein [Longilinea sp.]
MTLEPGLTHEMHLTVQESDTARASGGETLPPVLSTPRLIGYLERTAHQALLPHLAEGQSSVGTLVNIRHLAATPVGMNVRFVAELTGVEGRRMVFKVEAWDEVEKIAEGEHERFVIDTARFAERLTKKSAR